MKKWNIFLAGVLLAMSLSGCGSSGAGNERAATTSQNVETQTTAEENSSTGAEVGSETEAAENADAAEASDSTEGKTLIVYYSRTGNTRELVDFMAEQTGADVYEIVPLNPYPDDYTETTEVAQAEKESNARPEIKDPLESIEEYDRILVGYPIWWQSAPMIIGTFLESYDLTGVDVYPFSQSASMDTDQFELSLEFIRECAEGANVHDGLFARGSDTEAITEWLTANDLLAAAS